MYLRVWRIHPEILRPGLIHIVTFNIIPPPSQFTRMLGRQLKGNHAPQTPHSSR